MIPAEIWHQYLFVVQIHVAQMNVHADCQWSKCPCPCCKGRHRARDERQKGLVMGYDEELELVLGEACWRKKG